MAIVLNLVFMVFTIFFLLLDGRHLVKVLISAIPIEKSYSTLFLQKFRDMGKHLVTGYVLVAGLQAIVMLILCPLFRVKGGLVIAFLTAIASFIPMVGTALVWLPVSASKILAGDLAGGVLFFASPPPSSGPSTTSSAPYSSTTGSRSTPSSFSSRSWAGSEYSNSTASCSVPSSSSCSLPR